MKKFTAWFLLILLTAAAVLSLSICAIAAPQQNNANQDPQDPFWHKKGPGNQNTWQGNQGSNNNWNGQSKPNGPGNQSSWQGNPGPNNNWNSKLQPNGPGNPAWQGNQGSNNNWNGQFKPNGPGNPGSWQGNPGSNNNWSNPPKPNPGPWQGNPGSNNNWNSPLKPNPGPWQGNSGPNNNWNSKPQPNGSGNPGPWYHNQSPVVVYCESVQYQNSPMNQLRNEAGSVIHRTAMILLEAQRAANDRHYSFGLGKAIAHQQMARELFLKGSYQDAIFHAMRARNLAFQVLNGNHEALSWSYSPDEIEDSYCRQAPRDEDLDIRLNIQTVFTDLVAVFLKLDIDIQL